MVVSTVEAFPKNKISITRTTSMPSIKLISLNNIHTWITSLSSFHSRHSKSKYITQVGEWIKSLLETFGYADVYFHDYVEGGYQLKNVICDKKGTSDRDSVKFAFFSGEEQGQWGSKNYAQHIKENNVNLFRLINLDMVGNRSSSQAVIIERDMGNKVLTNDQDSQKFGQIMEQMAVNYTNLPVMLGPIYDSDYMPFEALGYVVVGVYDGGEGNPTYHSKTDVGSTINFEYAVSITKFVLATIVNEAGVKGV
jgi:hypothetical protein